MCDRTAVRLTNGVQLPKLNNALSGLEGRDYRIEINPTLLLTDKRVTRVPPSKAKMDDLRSIVSRSMKDVAAAGLSADARFIMASGSATPWRRHGAA